MKAYLLIVVVAAHIASQGSILVTEELSICSYLECTVIQHDLPEDLSPYEVIVIITPSTIYDEKEVSALKTFVESGGGLMLLAEENNKEGTTLVLNQLAQEFQVTFNIDRIYDDEAFVDHTSWVSLTVFPPHPVFQGVTNVVYTAGCSVEAEGLLIKASKHAHAEKYDGLVTYEEGSFPACMGFLEMGEGRIFVCGDTELFNVYLSLGDNTLFALNLFDWLAGNEERISTRIAHKNEALQLIPEAESLLQSAKEKGLGDILPESLETAEALILEAKTLYDAYKYSDSRLKALQAKQAIQDGENEAVEKVDSLIRAARECLEDVEKGAQKYLPSQLEAAYYYMQEADDQKTYLQKMEKANEALSLCEEIRQGLKGAAEKEIERAREKVESFRGLFGRSSHHLAQIYLEYAEESFESGMYGDALDHAQQSQISSDSAAKEQKKDYYLVAGLILGGILIIYLSVRK